MTWLPFLKANWKWLAPAALSAILLVRILILDAQLDGCRSTVKGLESQLDAIADEGERRQDRADDAAKEGQEGIEEAEREAERIEEAPLPDDCRTPEAVLEAEL